MVVVKELIPLVPLVPLVPFVPFVPLVPAEPVGPIGPVTNNEVAAAGFKRTDSIFQTLPAGTATSTVDVKFITCENVKLLPPAVDAAE